MINLDLYKTPLEMQRIIKDKAKKRRKKLKMTQSELAKRSGVSLGSVRRFEQSGEISLTSLLKIASVLNALDDFEPLFSQKVYSSLEEMLEDE